MSEENKNLTDEEKEAKKKEKEERDKRKRAAHGGQDNPISTNIPH